MECTRLRSRLAIVSLALLSATACCDGLSAEPLSGRDLRAFIAGRHVYLKVPLGGEMPLLYSANGIVDGSGDAVGLGKFLKPSDSGRWWIDGEKLCQKWSSWYDGKQFCFTIDRTSVSTLSWTRDDGQAGTARIGD